MALGYMIFSLIAGLAGAALALMAGASAWQAVAAFVVAGIAGIVLTAGVMLVRSGTPPARSPRRMPWQRPAPHALAARKADRDLR